MEIFKYTWAGMVSFFVGVAVDTFKEKLLHFLHIEPDQFSMSTLATVLMVIGAFQFGTKWHLIFKPITKFKWFLDLKIKQGQKLYNKKKHESLVTRKIPIDPPVIFPDGTAIGEQMDYSQTDVFRKLYADWMKQVSSGLIHAYGPSIKKEFNDELPISATFNSMSDMREDLKKDIRFLKMKRKGLKKDMLDKNFNPEFLEDYEKLEFS